MPHEHAPVLLVFGRHAQRVGSFVRLRPDLLTKLTFAPARAMHALAAYLFLSEEAHQPDQTVADIIAQRDPRALLVAAIPHAPRELFRALDRAGSRVLSGQFYAHLSALCAGPLADDVLASPRLDEARLESLVQWSQLDSLVLACRKEIGCYDHRLLALQNLLAFARAHGVLAEGDLCLPRHAGLSAMLRRLQTVLDRVRAPEVPFTLQPPLRLLRTIGELRAAGEAMENCLASPRGAEHWTKLAAGSALHVLCEAPRMLAELDRVAPGLCVLSYVAGPRNAGVAPEARDWLIRTLGRQGVQVLEDHPAQSINAIAADARRAGRNVEDCWELLDA